LPRRKESSAEIPAAPRNGRAITGDKIARSSEAPFKEGFAEEKGGRRCRKNTNTPIERQTPTFQGNRDMRFNMDSSFRDIIATFPDSESDRFESSPLGNSKP
jgi:hypothetical protein